MVMSLLQVQKTHVDWMEHYPTQQPSKVKELVHSSMARTESSLLILNLRSDNHFQHTAPITGALLQSPFLKVGTTTNWWETLQTLPSPLLVSPVSLHVLWFAEA